MKKVFPCCSGDESASGLLSSLKFDNEAAAPFEPFKIIHKYVCTYVFMYACMYICICITFRFERLVKERTGEQHIDVISEMKLALT
jgi:hypothetical protein